MCAFLEVQLLALGPGHEGVQDKHVNHLYLMCSNFFFNQIVCEKGW